MTHAPAGDRSRREDPSARWRQKRGAVPFSEALGFGAGFGLLPFVAGALLTGGTHGVEGFLRGGIFAISLGIAGSAVFWVLACWRTTPGATR